MVGTILNGVTILAGGIVGTTVRRELSRSQQGWLKIALGVFTVYAGLRLTWLSINGSVWQVTKQFLVILLALVLGNLLGKALRLQKFLNRVGQYAKDRLSQTQEPRRNRANEGFVICSILFCAGPLAILGALQEGLTGDFRTLAIKSVIDGLAAIGFARMFGWGVMLSAVPVVAYQGTITLVAASVQPILRMHELLDSITAPAGLLICCVALIILDLKKVQLADYLPSLLFAPLLTWLWR